MNVEVGGFWKFNVSHLQDETYVELIRQHIVKGTERPYRKT